MLNLLYYFEGKFTYDELLDMGIYELNLLVEAQSERNKKQAEANKKYINFDLPSLKK